MNYRNGITLYFVTVLHFINVKAMLITLHYGLMTADCMNTISKKGIFIFSTATIFLDVANNTFEIKVSIPLRYDFSFSYVCVFVCVCVCVCVLAYCLAHYLAILGAFTNFRRATVRFVMPVRPSVLPSAR
jgi:hypothetical protein